MPVAHDKVKSYLRDFEIKKYEAILRDIPDKTT